MQLDLICRRPLNLRWTQSLSRRSTKGVRARAICSGSGRVFAAALVTVNDRQDCRALAAGTTIDRLSLNLCLALSSAVSASASTLQRCWPGLPAAAQLDLATSRESQLGGSCLASSLYHSLPSFHFQYGCPGNAHSNGDLMRLCRCCIRRPQMVGPLGKERDWVLLVAGCNPRPSLALVGFQAHNCCIISPSALRLGLSQAVSFLG